LLEAWPEEEKHAGRSSVLLWPLTYRSAGRDSRMSHNSKGRWSRRPGFILSLRRRSAIPFARRSTRSVMANPIGFSFPKRKRPFTIWEVTAGKDALRFVVLRQELQQILSWISNRNHNPNLFLGYSVFLSHFFKSWEGPFDHSHLNSIGDSEVAGLPKTPSRNGQDPF
jgi:hypothetical protein